MGGACSACCMFRTVFLETQLTVLLGGGRKKNNYEPLLLENEREAVADLLQYLESELPLPAVPAMLILDRSVNNEFLHGVPARRPDDSFILGQC